MQLSKNFSLKEFQDASHRTLTREEQALAQYFANVILQPLRRKFGRIRISSFVRTGARIGGGNHANGDAVDIVPLDAPIDEVFEFLATYMTATFGEIIHERDHIHISRAGAMGEYGEVLCEPAEGQYVMC